MKWLRRTPAPTEQTSEPGPELTSSSFAAEAELEPGTSFHGYAIDSVLGRGGFGIAYLLRHEQSAELSVLKAILPDRFRDRAAVESFYEEITRLLQIPPHPNIVPIRLSWIDYSTNTPYLLMDYVPGGDLWSFVGSGGRLPVCDCWWVLLNVVEAMRFLADEVNVVHRDLKPQNMLVDANGIIKVTDFGLATIAADAANRGSITGSAESGLAGTLHFMSPEQLSRAHEIDARSDLWSVGVSLYWLCTGTLPFHGRAVDEQILRSDPTPPSLLNGDVDGRLESIILRCLQKDKVDRYESFRELELTAMASVQLEEVLAQARVHTRLLTQEAVTEYLVPYFRPQPGRQEERAPDGSDWLSYLQRLLNLIQLDDLAQAERMVAEGLAIDPDGPILLCYRAMILARRGEFDEAARAFETLFDHVDPQERKIPAIAYAEGIRFYRMIGQYEEARAVHRGAEERLRNEADPAYREHFEETIREEVAQLHHEYDKEVAERFGVEVDFDKLFDETSENDDWNELAAAQASKRAIIMVERGLYEPALQQFRRAVALAPDYGYAWADLGTCLMEMKRYDEAFDALERASVLVDDVITWFHLAKVSAALGRWDEALASVDEALRLEPEHEQAWFAKGVALLDGLDRSEEALRCFETAQDLGHPDAAEQAERCRELLRPGR
jgi:serine/threonine protein kinase/Flp pilus assembly protein TadD